MRYYAWRNETMHFVYDKNSDKTLLLKVLFLLIRISPAQDCSVHLYVLITLVSILDSNRDIDNMLFKLNPFHILTTF